MSAKNNCYTYFRIVGNFDPDYVSELLNLKPEKAHKIGDVRRNGTKYDFATWEFGKCNEYDAHVSNQMQKTILPLLNKVDLLNQIRNQNDVKFYLEIVPHIYAGEINPCLSPSIEVIDFCHNTRTEIDIDMYLYNSTDE